MTVELDVGVNELHVGDKVIAYKVGFNATWTLNISPRYVKATDDGCVFIHFAEDDQLCWKEPRRSTTLFRVIRGQKSVASTGKWNDKCALCKGNIYVGFIQVEHEHPCRKG